MKYATLESTALFIVKARQKAPVALNRTTLKGTALFTVKARNRSASGTLPALLILLLLSSCGGQMSALLWTDRPEFAIYAQLYNSSQNRYRIEVKYFDVPAERLLDSEEIPDMVIGKYLNSIHVITSFQDLNFLFNEGTVQKDSFYPALLKLGAVKKNQYLLPVSFNIPAILFKNNGATVPSNYMISVLDELRRLGAEYNEQIKGDWIRKGFSPLWDKNNDFLFITAQLFGIEFEEIKNSESKKVIRLNWDNEKLEQFVQYIKEWIALNGGLQAEDDFIYKYFFNLPPKLIAEGRIRFAYSKSRDYFLLPQGANSGLDFRWLSREQGLPVTEDSVLFGIHKKSRARNATADFAAWFFNAETQNLLLEESCNKHLNETVFGIADGFSSMRQVNEFVFPKYYINLLGHIPPAEYLVVSAPLPASWSDIKEYVIIPYMLDVLRETPAASRTLRERLTEWRTLKRDAFR